MFLDGLTYTSLARKMASARFSIARIIQRIKLRSKVGK
jgi:hypothetical protein